MNERHALDKTAFLCISLFAGAFIILFFGGAFGNACRCQTGFYYQLKTNLSSPIPSAGQTQRDPLHIAVFIRAMV